MFVICFIGGFERLARAFALDIGDLQAVIFFGSAAGAAIGFTATWDESRRRKKLGITFCVLNCVVFAAYGAFFMLFAYGSK